MGHSQINSLKTHNSIPQSSESIDWMLLCKPRRQLGYDSNRVSNI